MPIRDPLILKRYGGIERYDRLVAENAFSQIVNQLPPERISVRLVAKIALWQTLGLAVTYQFTDLSSNNSMLIGLAAGGVTKVFADEGWRYVNSFPDVPSSDAQGWTDTKVFAIIS